MKCRTALLVLVLAGTFGCRAFRPDFGDIEVPEVRSLRERAAHHDALLELRLDTLLRPAMRSAAVDCWIVVSDAARPDPLFSFLVRSGTRPRGRAALLACDTGSSLERLAVGRGLEANEGLYRVQTTADDAGVAAALAARIAELQPGRIAVDRSPTLPLADGLSATQEAWLEPLLGTAEPVSSASLVEAWLGAHVEGEAAAFVETARLVEAMLHEVLSDRFVVAAGTSVGELTWGFRDRALAHGLEVAGSPRSWVVRQGDRTAAADAVGGDPLLQPGDLVFLEGGIRYLGYGVRMGRWAYLLPDGELQAPDWVLEGLDATATALTEATAGLRPGVPAGDLLDAVAGRIAAPGVGLRLVRAGRLYDPGGDIPEPGVEATLARDRPLPAPTFLGARLAHPTDVAPWGRSFSWELVEAFIVEAAGVRFAVPPQRQPYLID